MGNIKVDMLQKWYVGVMEEGVRAIRECKRCFIGFLASQKSKMGTEAQGGKRGTAWVWDEKIDMSEK